MTRPSVLALTGPTGVGKTSLSLAFARALDAEIISCDSRQIYRQLDIGTAKPSADELSAVPHHFISELGLEAPWSAGTFAKEAERRIAEIHGRGRRALVVGGSTLYLHALAHGLAPLPAPNLALRDELNAVVESEGGRESLFAELQRVDPEAAETLDSTKTQRLVRFVGVYRSTGRPISSFWREAPVPAFAVRVVVLDRPRAELYERIDTRVDHMLEAGLLEEVRGLRDRGFSRESTPALRTIGYQEPLAHLEGELAFEDMVERLKRNTRRYAKRQLTWFRRRDEYVWRSPDRSIAEILAAFENP